MNEHTKTLSTRDASSIIIWHNLKYKFWNCKRNLGKFLSNIPHTAALIVLACGMMINPAVAAEFVFSGGNEGTITTEPPSSISGTYSFTATGPGRQSLTPITNGLSFFGNFPDTVWNLDSQFAANISAPGFRYKLLIQGNNGSGGGFGAFFDQYTFNFPGATGTGTIRDPLDQLTTESTTIGQTSFLQRRTSDSVPPGLPVGFVCRDFSSGAIPNNCLRWSSLSPAISGSGTVNFLANSGRAREGFLFTIMSEADIRVSKTVNDAQLSAGESSSYVITVEHLGDDQQSAAIDLRIADLLPAGITAGTPIFTSIGGFEGNPSFSGGVLTVDTLDFGQTLTMTLPFTVNADATPGSTITSTTDPASITMVQTDPIDNHGPLSASFLVASPALSLNPLTAFKTASVTSVFYGGTVVFTLEFQNDSAANLSDVILQDRLPTGLIYTPGTAMVDGIPREPRVDRATLNWDGFSLPAGNSVTVTLATRVVSDTAGAELINRTFATDTTGARLSNVATATVRQRVEHVFDCTYLIGKVYDDLNQNGYQDEGEPGLPGVRIATVRGELITTDQYGRYHVPCQILPTAIGSNVILKLDTRTLPSGYRLTTENPRVLRVTAGKMARVNFGAAISNVVRLDLDATAFEWNTCTGRQAMIAPLYQALDRLVDDLAGNPAVIRLRYHVGDEFRREAKRNLDIVERHLRKIWPDRSGTQLLIERELNRIGK